MDTRGCRHPGLRGTVIGVGPSVSGKRGARLERERRGQPADRCPIHAIGASDLSLRLAGRQPRQRLLTLERVELRLATELHAASLSAHPAGVRSILDEFALELRESAEDGQMRRGGIRPSIFDRPETGARFADLV